MPGHQLLSILEVEEISNKLILSVLVSDILLHKKLPSTLSASNDNIYQLTVPVGKESRHHLAGPV